MLNTAFTPNNRAVDRLLQRDDLHADMTAITKAIMDRAATYPLNSPDREALMQIAIQNAELSDRVARILL
jgi:hypothetical protein